MSKLIIILDVDLDTRDVDPHEVAEEVLDDHDSDGNRLDFPIIRPYADCPTSFVGAEWLDGAAVDVLLQEARS